MILEHEIPQGSKLYFGKSAKIKRQIENLASDIFEEFGYMEIITPTFCYLEHQRNFKSRKLVRLSNESNQPISLRIDSTLDLMRILTKRLLRSNQHKKWFYIQPIFTYPTSEIHQMGLENIGDNSTQEIITIAQKLLSAFEIPYIWQLFNMNIPHLCSLYSSIPLEYFIKMDIPKILEGGTYIRDLLKINDEEMLKQAIPTAPHFLRDELKILLELGTQITGKKKIFSPLYCPSISYYHHLGFSVFWGNQTLLSGGQYEISGITSSGFGIYTDPVIDIILQQGQI